MSTTGHKTEAVYRRCAIVSEADTADGLANVAALLSKWGTDVSASLAPPW